MSGACERHGATGGPAVVGIAGKSCAGKDLVTRWLLRHDWREINVDHLGHQALRVRREEILAVFGPEILTDDRSVIDRARLGRIVFADPDRLRELEAIVHPWMRDEVRRRVEAFRSGAEGESEGGVRGLVINAALLFHMQLDSYCDVILLVRAPMLRRVVRALKRDGFAPRRIASRLWTQRHLETQARRSGADIITVDNRGKPEALSRRLEAIPQLQ